MDPIPPSAGSALGLLLLLVATLVRGDTGLSGLGAGLAAASALGALVTTSLLSGLEINLEPRAFRDWALLAVLVCVPLGSIASRGRGAAAVVAVTIGALLVGLFLHPTESLHERYWGGRVALHVGGLSAVALACVLTRWGQARASRIPEGMMAFALAGVAAAPTLGFTGTGVSAAIAGGVAGSAGLFGVAAALVPRLRNDLGAIGMAAGTTQAMVLVGALATGALYAETPLWSAALLALAPLWTLLPGTGVRGGVIRLALVLATVAVPAVMAYLNQPEPNPYG